MRTTTCSMPSAAATRQRVTNASAGSRLQPGAQGLLDLLVGATEVGAVPGEDRELVGHGAAAVGDVEQVAGVGVTGHQPQGLALLGAADQHRRVRAPDGRRAADWPPQPVVPTFERGVVAGPHPGRDLQRLLEPLEPLGHRRQRQAHGVGLLAVVAGAEPEPGPPTREHVQGGDRLDQQGRGPEGDPGDHGAEPDPLGLGGQEPQGGVGLQHLGVAGCGGRVGLEQMVGHPDGVDPGLLGGAGQPRQRRAEPARAARPGSSWSG